MIKTNEWPLIRFIEPIFPEINVFSKVAQRTTSLGLIMVATSANKLWGWRVEVINENNYKGPRNENGLPDHIALQKEKPATAVGFYCGLSSTIERVWELAEFYHQQGVFNIAGSWHAHYCPEETLKHNIDIVVHGAGDEIIQRILDNLQNKDQLKDIPGISFWDKGKIKRNNPERLGVLDLNKLPYPDFGLLRYAKMKTYPISRIRGCSMNCEFCSVREKPCWASPEYLFNTVKWLVETRKARRFFIVDDRLEENPEGTKRFFQMISEAYNSKLVFSVQIRLETAKNKELLEIMKNAGVRIACVGYESPIDEDLKAMRKGYSSAKMLEWTKTLKQYIRWIHGMFIIGYPVKGNSIDSSKILKHYKRFIRKSCITTIQVLLPVPIPGSDLRKRLENRLLNVPWRYYDGSYPCFKPNGVSPRELQDMALKLMKQFYDVWSFFRIPLKTIIFPYLIRGWSGWLHAWLKDIIKYGAYRLVRKWHKKQKNATFFEDLNKSQE